MGQHYISEDCTNCSACADTCPSEAISESGDFHVIDQELCVDCEACVDACPVGAIQNE